MLNKRHLWPFVFVFKNHVTASLNLLVFPSILCKMRRMSRTKLFHSLAQFNYCIHHHIMRDNWNQTLQRNTSPCSTIIVDLHIFSMAFYVREHCLFVTLLLVSEFNISPLIKHLSLQSRHNYSQMTIMIKWSTFMHETSFSMVCNICDYFQFI